MKFNKLRATLESRTAIKLSSYKESVASTEKVIPLDLFSIVKNSGVVNRRHPVEVLGKAMEELGELATEVGVYTGYLSPDKGGADGIPGEAADLIIAVLDIVQLSHPEVTEEQFTEILKKKVYKWQSIGKPKAGKVELLGVKDNVESIKI